MLYEFTLTFNASDRYQGTTFDLCVHTVLLSPG